MIFFFLYYFVTHEIKETCITGYEWRYGQLRCRHVIAGGCYEVAGVTFRFYDSEGFEESLDDARNLASRLNIPHIIYDARELFRERIIRYFIDEYLAGHTPVPCTLCNNELKWKLLVGNSR